jgi:hypothetical protein
MHRPGEFLTIFKISTDDSKPLATLDISESFERERVLCKARREPIEKVELPFDETGFLLPGTYRLSLAEFHTNFATNEHRRALLGRFEPAIEDAKVAGLQEIIVGGSFVSKKPDPNDLDLGMNLKSADMEILKARNSELLSDRNQQRETLGAHILDGRVHVKFSKTTGAAMEYFNANREGQDISPYPFQFLLPPSLFLRYNARLDKSVGLVVIDLTRD